MDEGRSFNEKQADDQFFVEATSEALCLPRREFVQIFKDYDLKRHYPKTRSAKFSVCEGLCLEDEIAGLKKSLSSPQKFFQKVTIQEDSTIKASYTVAYLIAKKSKPFTDGEFIKRCIECTADIICHEKRGILLKSVYLTKL